MTPRELSERLAREAEAVAKHLLPNGKREGREWRCGSLAGDEGKSLGVHLAGDKAGVWADFASGESGDLIDLWRLTQRLSMSETLKAASAWLGVTMDAPKFARKERTYKAPTIQPKPTQEMSKGWKYMIEQRGLSPDTIRAFRIGETERSILFPFYDDAGQLVMCKWRNLAEKKCGVTEKDMRPVLFGWQAMPPDARWCAITEGEFDAMALHEYGIAALSVPFGGGAGAKQDWIEHEYDRLQRFDEIFLCLDMDDEGRKATAEIADRLGRHRCQVVQMPMKDANECLLGGVTKEVMWEAFATAKTMDPGELKNAIDYHDAVINAFHPDEQALGIRTPWEKCKTLAFRPGEVTLIAGVNGHGKSEGVGHFSLDAIAQGQRVCVASLEFKPERWLARLVRQASGMEQPTDEYISRIMGWLGGAMWVFDVTGTAKRAHMLEVFAYARRRYGINLFVIDNISKLDLDLDDYNGQREFVDQLTDFAKSHDVHVFLVAHLRKGEDDGKPGGKFDVKGSGAITDLVDTVLIWWRNRRKEEKLKLDTLSEVEREELEQQPDAVCLCEKQRNGEDEPRIGLWFHKPSHQFLGSKDAPPREYVRLGSVPYGYH